MIKFDEIITKEVFEATVPAAKTPDRNDSIFNRISSGFGEAAAHLEQFAESEEIIERVYNSFAGKDASQNPVVKWICLEAFITRARSLDLTLTGTGFGIVSSSSVAPASAARVNSMIAELQLQQLLVRYEIIKRLKYDPFWVESPSARREICTLFWNPEYVKHYTMLPLTAETWVSIQQKAVEADALLRNVISSEYMDELMFAERRELSIATSSPYDKIIVEMCLKVIGTFISNYETTKELHREMCDAIRQKMERNIAYYPVYRHSSLYEAKHSERYQNKKNDSTFFFFT